MAARSLGELFVEIGARTGKLKKGFAEAGDKLQKFGKQAMKIGAVMGGAGTAISLALGKITKDTIDYGVKLDKLRKTVDATADELSRLGYAAEQEHADFDTLGKGLTILSKYMHYAEQGMATYKREFDAMGVSVTDADGKLRSAYDVFLDMSDWMHTSGAPETEKTAVAFTLLGRSGKELIPMLKTGKDHIKALGDEAEELGITMDDKTAAAMKALSDEITKAKKGLKGIALEIGTTLAPILGKLVKYAQAAFQWFKNLPGPWKRGITIATALGGALLMVGGALTMIVGALAVAIPAAMPIIGGLAGALAPVIAAAVALAAGLTAIHFGIKQIEKARLSEVHRASMDAVSTSAMRMSQEIRRSKKELEELAKQGITTGKKVDLLKNTIERCKQQIGVLGDETRDGKYEMKEAKGIISIFGLEIDKLKAKMQGLVPTLLDDLNLKIDDYTQKTDEATEETKDLSEAFQDIWDTTDLLQLAYPGLVAHLGFYGEAVDKAKEKTKEFSVDGQQMVSTFGQACQGFADGFALQMRGMTDEAKNAYDSTYRMFAEMIKKMMIKLAMLAALKALFPGGSIFGIGIGRLIGLAKGGILRKAQHGAMLVTQPTIYKGVLTGEGAPELISPIDKLLEAIQPQVFVHEAGPNTWVEVLLKADDSHHDRLYREKFVKAQKRDLER